MGALYPSDANAFASSVSDATQTIEVGAEWDGEPHFVASPPDLEGALAVLASHPEATIVAGATDVGVRINKTLTVPERFWT